MLSDKARLALFDIRDNIMAAQNFVADLTFEEFKRSILHYYATVRALEIIWDTTHQKLASLLSTILVEIEAGDPDG